MPARTQIRPFRPSHLGPILQIERSAFPGESYTRDMFRELSERCGALFFVAKYSGRIIGYMVTCIHTKNAEIVSIAVDPRHRNKGVGRELMEHTLAKLKSSGIRRVDLTVRSTNRAGIHFYRRVGFSRVGRIARYYADGADALHMRKTL